MFPHRHARRALALALFLLGMAVGWAAPPPGTDLDGALHEWFETQHSVDGAWCCDVADGFILAGDDWRQVGDHYEVRISGEWHPIPSDTLRDPHGGANPTGSAIVWYRGEGPDLHIYCFAPGFEY
jgi:hypothetical protein